MTTKQATCEDRIKDQLAGRIDDMRQWLDDYAADADADCDNLDSDGLSPYNGPLAVERKVVYRVLLSTGGPGDWLDVWLDADGGIDRVDYVFQDWFDGARVTLDLRQQHKVSDWLDHIWMEERE